MLKTFAAERPKHLEALHYGVFLSHPQRLVIGCAINVTIYITVFVECVSEYCSSVADATITEIFNRKHLTHLLENLERSSQHLE
uniref:Uncharacterized protein n=1 Tax=Steinernema glaseri TaxID=37863 RepID=A0A1I7ZRE9_9BILA